MVFRLIHIIISCVMRFLMLPISIEGYTFNLWEIFIFGFIVTAFGVIIVGLMKGD